MMLRNKINNIFKTVLIILLGVNFYNVFGAAPKGKLQPPKPSLTEKDAEFLVKPAINRGDEERLLQLRKEVSMYPRIVARIEQKLSEIAKARGEAPAPVVPAPVPAPAPKAQAPKAEVKVPAPKGPTPVPAPKVEVKVPAPAPKAAEEAKVPAITQGTAVALPKAQTFQKAPEPRKIGQVTVKRFDTRKAQKSEIKVPAPKVAEEAKVPAIIQGTSVLPKAQTLQKAPEPRKIGQVTVKRFDTRKAQKSEIKVPAPKVVEEAKVPAITQGTAPSAEKLTLQKVPQKRRSGKADIRREAPKAEQSKLVIPAAPKSEVKVPAPAAPKREAPKRPTLTPKEEAKVSIPPEAPPFEAPPLVPPVGPQPKAKQTKTKVGSRTLAERLAERKIKSGEKVEEEKPEEKVEHKPEVAPKPAEPEIPALAPGVIPDAPPFDIGPKEETKGPAKGTSAKGRAAADIFEAARAREKGLKKAIQEGIPSFPEVLTDIVRQYVSPSSFAQELAAKKLKKPVRNLTSEQKQISDQAIAKAQAAKTATAARAQNSAVIKALGVLEQNIIGGKLIPKEMAEEIFRKINLIRGLAMSGAPNAIINNLNKFLMDQVNNIQAKKQKESSKAEKEFNNILQGRLMKLLTRLYELKYNPYIYVDPEVQENLKMFEDILASIGLDISDSRYSHLSEVLDILTKIAETNNLQQLETLVSIKLPQAVTRASGLASSMTLGSPDEDFD